jgi:hypothetical protein
MTEQGTVFDAAEQGDFVLDEPPVPWIDLGWVDGFKRHCGTKIAAIRTGAPTTVAFQARTEIEATVTLRFQSWGKLQLALASGVQQMNLLATASGAVAQGSGGTAIPAVPLVAGSTANVLQVGTTAAAAFTVGQLVAVDVDYSGQTGFIGGGVSGAYVKTALTDVDYVRRISLNVGRIAAISEGALTLQWPLIAGAPSNAMKVSAVVGFCDREGSSFFQEWSALFVGEGQQGERLIWHYPRLQAMTGATEAVDGVSGGYEKVLQGGMFRALPVKDPLDGESVVCFRSYVMH